MRDRPGYADAHRHKTPVHPSPTQVTHHRNEDKTDGSPANLEVQERGKHTAQHNRSRGLSKLRASLRMVKERRKLY